MSGGSGGVEVKSDVSATRSIWSGFLEAFLGTFHFLAGDIFMNVDLLSSSFFFEERILRGDPQTPHRHHRRTMEACQA